MPVRIGSLQGERRPLEVPWQNDIVKLWYWPAVYTAEYEDKVVTLTDTNRNAGALAVMLAELIDEWDVIDIDGAGNEIPYPLTEQNLRLASVAFTRTLWDAITEDASKHNPTPVLNRRARRARANRA